MIYAKVLTTIFLLLQGNTIPTLYGGFENVEIDNNKEMSLYIDYEQLFNTDTLSYTVNFIDTSLDSAIYIETYSNSFDGFTLIQQPTGVLENLPLLPLVLDSDSSLLFIPAFDIVLSGNNSGYYSTLRITYYDYVGDDIYNETYYFQSIGLQIVEEYLRSYSEDFGGDYEKNTNANGTIALSYVPNFEITLPFTFSNDLFFKYTIADYKNSYQAYTSIDEAKDLIYNLGKQEVINNPGIYDLYTKTEYDQNYDRGYDNGKLDAETPVGLNWVKAAINVFFGFLGFMILPGVTLGDIFSGLIILLILKWVLGWFRG